MDVNPQDLSGTVFMTGATGFIGRRLLHALLQRGRQVIALCREPAELSEFDSQFLKVVVGRLEDPKAFTSALAEANTVFNLAAQRSQIGLPLSQYLATNVDSTLALAQLSMTVGIDRFIHVSTALIFGSIVHNRNPEIYSSASQEIVNHYISSRLKAQKELMSEVENGLPLITACPTIVFGPDSPDHPNRVTDQLRRVMKTRVDLVLDGGIHKRNLVYVEDVVGGLLLVESKGLVGEVYILGGENISHRELNLHTLSTAGLSSRISLSIPRKVVSATAKILDLIKKFDPGSGYKAAANTLMTEWCYNSSKAETQLGYQYIPFKQALKKTLTYISHEL